MGKFHSFLHYRRIYTCVGNFGTTQASMGTGDTPVKCRLSNQLSYFVISASTLFNFCFMPLLESNPMATLREGSGLFASLWKSRVVALSVSPPWSVPLFMW